MIYNSYGIETNSTSLSANKFKKLNLVENSIVLIKKNKEETSISFSELNRIYIKKYKFSFLKKMGLSSIILALIFFLSIYLSIEIMLIISFLAILLIAKINTYKRYELNLLLNDGTFFIKNFYNGTKQANINIANIVREKKFENQIKLNIQNEI